MKVSKSIFTLLILLTSFQISFGQQKIKDDSCQIPFELKYERIGVLFLLLNEQYFKPQELKNLFLCLSKKRSKLAFLSITALSDKQQLDKAIKSFTNDLTAPAGLHPPTIFYPKGWKPEPPPPPNYYRGFYYRYKNEYFEYSANPQQWKMTTIVLKNKELKKEHKTNLKKAAH
jgi:hypothetical protein